MMSKIFTDQSIKRSQATDEISYRFAYGVSKGSPREKVISTAHDKYGRFIGGKKRDY